MNNYYQPNVITDARALATNKILRQAYMLVGISMIPTVIGAFIALSTNFAAAMLQNYTMTFIGIMFGFYGLSYLIEKNKTSVNGLVLMMVFTLFMGVALAPLLYIALSLSNGIKLISVAAGGTAVLFMGLAAIGSNAEKDFSFLGRYLGMACLVLMGTVFLNFFFLKMPMISIVLSSVFIAFSSAVIVYRINSVVRGGEDNYISVALDIYIGLYNIFSALLRLLIIFTGRD